MWSLIVKKGLPLTRSMRYCCLELKEKGGKGRMKITGVRAAESVNRAKNVGMIKMINPIIDWIDSDVWEFLNHYGCKSNPLYQCSKINGSYKILYAIRNTK